MRTVNRLSAREMNGFVKLLHEWLVAIELVDKFDAPQGANKKGGDLLLFMLVIRRLMILRVGGKAETKSVPLLTGMLFYMS
jgi:hypothetical protein